MFLNLWLDDGGAIVSAELVLVMTILVLGLVVGLNEVATSVNSELNDISNAIGSVNQSFFYSGFHARKGSGWGGWGGWGGGGSSWCGSGWGTKAWTPGSAFIDTTDDCDNDYDITCAGASGETAVSCQLNAGGVRQGAIHSGSPVLIGPGSAVSSTPTTPDTATNGPVMQVP